MARKSIKAIFKSWRVDFMYVDIPTKFPILSRNWKIINYATTKLQYDTIKISYFVYCVFQYKKKKYYT